MGSEKEARKVQWKDVNWAQEQDELDEQKNLEPESTAIPI